MEMLVYSRSHGFMVFIMEAAAITMFEIPDHDKCKL